jgi:hypothetical protein
MQIRRFAGLLLVVLFACTGDADQPAESTTSESPTSQPTAPTGLVPAPPKLLSVCTVHNRIDDPPRQGTETADERIAIIDRLQLGVESYADVVTHPGARKVLGRLVDALGQLEIAVDAAGQGFRHDKVVQSKSWLVAIMVARTCVLARHIEFLNER